MLSMSGAPLIKRTRRSLNKRTNEEIHHIRRAVRHAHAMDRSVDVQRQQYALQVAEFNMKYRTNVVATKKGVIVYDAKSNTATTANVNNIYHGAHEPSLGTN
jgi:hypothetical protein